MLRISLTVLLSLAASTAGAQALVPESGATAEEQAALRSAEERGSAIFRHDQAAAVATDAMLELRAFKRDHQLSGWITEQREDRILVTFLGQKGEDAPMARYRAWVGADGRLDGKAQALTEPEALTPFEAAAAKARAVNPAFEPCSKRYNTVVLPADASLQKWTIYLLPGTPESGVVPLGGSYRVDLDLAADEAEVRGYTKSCVQLDNPNDAVGLMVSHLLDPTPTEVHVFWSLWAGKPMYVATTSNGKLWSIEDGRVRLVKEGK